MKNYIHIPAFILLIFSGCTPSPRPVEFGHEECAFCKMNVVDQQYAAELVTEKGRVYVFDATECMLAYMNDHSETPFAYILVSDYHNPGTWIPASTAHFLISPQLPSPMGANITGFVSQAVAQKMQAEYPGMVLSWEELQKQQQR
ncbi:MAG: hypothetical protein GYB31_05260 [Bacteroidetes bacterium]|nr:hypothetical protein [Bacteroidota bacterium]